jgi:hypothetical protein
MADPRFARTPLKQSGAIAVTSTSKSAARYLRPSVFSGIGFAVAIVLRIDPHNTELTHLQNSLHDPIEPECYRGGFEPRKADYSTRKAIRTKPFQAGKRRAESVLQRLAATNLDFPPCPRGMNKGTQT